MVGQCADVAALQAVGCEVQSIPGCPGSVAQMLAQDGPEATQERLVHMICQSRPQYPAFGVIAKSAADLMREQLPPVRFAVDGLIPYGLSILAAPSKIGKSWMALDMCLAVTSGGAYLGHKANKGTVLYLALEDSYQRLQSRLDKLLRSRPAPSNLHLAIQAPDLDNGLIEQLGYFVDANPDTNLIILDTLQKIRGATRGRESGYACDYREVGALKAFADQRGLALLVVHHLRKMVDDSDPFNRISGTSALMGASDATLVITKDKRADVSASLWITGRDVEESQTIIRWDKDSCRWDSLGDADAYAQAQARMDYDASPLVKTIRELVRQAGPEGWTGTARQIMDAGLLITGQRIATTAQALSKELAQVDSLLVQYDAIYHQRKSNGSGGGKHVFSKCLHNRGEQAQLTI